MPELTRVRLIRAIAGAAAGDVVHVPAWYARILVLSGRAERVETAAVQPPEHAARRTGRADGR